MRAALYLRVSTSEQNCENQEAALREAAERMGYTIVQVFKDHGISGSKGRDKRPAFDALHKVIARRQIDIVLCWSVDRLGRSMQDLVAFLAHLHATGVELFLHQQGLDTTTPAGRAMFQMMGVFAEFERALIVERVKAGLKRARERGTKSGKAIGRPQIAAAKRAAIREAYQASRGLRRVAAQFGVSRETVRTIVASA
jgi:DNA invertase Pin-like site-specific DNA recombinase